ncbi:hypothetical protein NG895_17130 [Aeoliella sp. ICT_H6.2]|uniref:Uncharacterized protein n=1 Tax=Aeoliella straminimaris TaxID=2954799 RepID=A0A9X2FCI1_9BACT|nr:hypothetical protein [Aeoliella straminimaris]MCO6045623.1 hypothetical protein [Aeoliella straminimaris]
MRYSLSFMFLVATLLCLSVGVWAWLGALGLLLWCGIFGLVFATFGFAYKNRLPTVLGLGIVAAIAAILFIDMSGGVIWDGHFTLAFDVTVLDADTSAPVQDAELTVGRRNWDMDTYTVDSNGKALFSHSFPCGGHDSALGITKSSWRNIPLDWYFIKITTSDGTEQTYSLAKAVGRDALPMGDAALPPIVLRLQQD